LSENLKKGVQLADQSVDEGIILEVGFEVLIQMVMKSYVFLDINAA
jgi:hypothetical protein